MYSLYDSSHNFDSLHFTPYNSDVQAAAPNLAASESCIFTNYPYLTQQMWFFNPGTLFSGIDLESLVTKTSSQLDRSKLHSDALVTGIVFDPLPVNWLIPKYAPPYFVCRRQNWNASCHLMQATHTTGSALYTAYGAGDIIPFKLDPELPVGIDKKPPSHMFQLTQTITDRLYISVKNFSVANTPFVLGVTNQGGVPQYMNFSISSSSTLASLVLTTNQALQFPTDCYVIGQSSTSLTSIDSINAATGLQLTDTGAFVSYDDSGTILDPSYQVVPYNNLVYLIRAVSNVPGLGTVGSIGTSAGFLVDTFVASAAGNLVLAQGARYKRSGMQFFGSTYTPTTMIDSLDTLDFTSITGVTFYAPTIFIPVPELDASKEFIANLSNFLSLQVWTLIYPEVVVTTNDGMANGVQYPNGWNVDNNRKPILTLQKLHFIYDSMVTMFTPNDLAHKYPLQPKQRVLALNNDQILEGICWRSANVQQYRDPPTNVSAQQILPVGIGMDASNIIYSPNNRPVTTPKNPSYMGMSLNSIISLSGVAFNIEEAAMTQQTNDPTGAKTKLISAVSSTTNLLIGLVFDYDNNDQGTLPTPLTSGTKSSTSRGIVFLNGYLGATGFSFSSPDHFDVNDVLVSQVPKLEQITQTMGGDWDVAFYNTDLSLPRQFWTMTYDTFTSPGASNYIATVPPSLVDPNFSNRTRSLILSLENDLRPDAVGLIDTYASVVSASLHLQNGITGSVFLSKKADRDVLSMGSTGGAKGVFGSLTAGYDFFIFSKDHYGTLTDATFDLFDNGYAMSLVDDGTGTGNKVAKYFTDPKGNYYELFTYVIWTPKAGIIETNSFLLKITLATPASGGTPATPSSVNPQDIVNELNNVSQLMYAAFGPSAPGLPPAVIPIQAVNVPGGTGNAAPLNDPPGINGYQLNSIGANLQPIQITQIFLGSMAYNIAGSTTIQPYNTTLQQLVPFYGTISHGLDPQNTINSVLQSADRSSFIPRTGSPTTLKPVGGGAGLGSFIGNQTLQSQFSWCFQGMAPILASESTTSNTIVSGDDSTIYTYNAISNTIVDSVYGRTVLPVSGQYYIDNTASNPVYGVIILPSFILNGNTYNININTIDPGTTNSRYTLITGDQSFLFDKNDNIHVTVDDTRFTFNAVPLTGGAYTVSYAAVDQSTTLDYPSPITITPFTICAGGIVKYIDVFNHPELLEDMVLGSIGRLYAYNLTQATMTVTVSGSPTTYAIQTEMIFTSLTGFGYAISSQGGTYTVNGGPIYPYQASNAPTPASYALMTAPQMFTIGGNFYSFNKDVNGNYISVSGNGQTNLINPYRFSLNGAIQIINTNVQPNTVNSGGTQVAMTAGNTQFILDSVQYTIALRQNSLNGAIVSGQFNIAQGNIVIIENYVYQIDNLNGRIVGNGTTYPLTTSGLTYTITAANNTFTVTTKPNATTVLISNIVYQINNTTVVGDGITYPIIKYRTFLDGTTKFIIEIDGTMSVAPPLPLSGVAPYTNSTFIDGTTTYTVNNVALFDGTNYYLQSSTSANTFSISSTLTFTIRIDGVAIYAGSSNTYLVNTGSLNQNQITWNSSTNIYFNVTQSSNPLQAAFDGEYYYAINNNEFTDGNGLTWTIEGNTAINQGNSYEIYSNLGQPGSSYFQVPGGLTYYVNLLVAVAEAPSTWTGTGFTSGDIYSVFPMTSTQFTIPLRYTFTITGSTVSVLFPFNTVFVSQPTLVASSGKLEGGYFSDPVTGIVYQCIVSPSQVTFVDSNNATHPYPAPGMSSGIVASVIVTTGYPVAVSNQTGSPIYPIPNGQFTVGTTMYTIGDTVAYQNAAGPYWPIQNGRFTVPRTAPLSNVDFTISGGMVTKGYSLGGDDQFTPDGNTFYAVNETTVVKTSNQSTLSSTTPLTVIGALATYTLQEPTATAPGVASLPLAGVNYNTATKKFTVTYAGGVKVTYKVGLSTVIDNSVPLNGFTLKKDATNANLVWFLDFITNVTFSFNKSGNNPITAQFQYQNGVFGDTINNIQYNVDENDKLVETTVYLPETTQYAFMPADGNKYLIHYNNVGVVFPIIAGSSINAGTALVGNNTFTVDVDEVVPVDGSAPIPINQNSFEINGSLYTIQGTPNSPVDYSPCWVTGANYITQWPFLTATTFQLIDTTVTYTLMLDPTSSLPVSVTTTYIVVPSANLLTVNDSVYMLTYTTTTQGSVLGQGQTFAIQNSSFSLLNDFDLRVAPFYFADANIYDAASVVGQFTIYTSPTFAIAGMTYAFNSSSQVVTDNNNVPYPLVTNPSMFSINGSNYLIDTNQTPHGIVGNNNVSPLATDVTIVRGKPFFDTTFTLSGYIYKYTEDSSGNVATITGVTTYAVSQPGLTFRLNSSLLFTIVKVAPTSGNYPGNVVPIGSITAIGNLRVNLYAGIPQTGSSDFFIYNGQLYTLIASSGTYVSVQASYPLYASQPQPSQQQLAAFSLGGTTYLVTCGTTSGDPSPAGTNPGTIWAATSPYTLETQCGNVYGFTAQPTAVTRSATQVFQFPVTDSNGHTILYDIQYTLGASTNQVHVDTTTTLPGFWQSIAFGNPFTAFPITFETGGYNAFSSGVDETATPQESFSCAYKTPVISNDSYINSLMPAQGDFSIEFWHSIPANGFGWYHPYTYSAQNTNPLIYYTDIAFNVESNPPLNATYVQINNVIMQANNIPADFSSLWRHIALTYTQVYAMACQGAGYEVQDGTNFNFDNDFSIGMVFGVSDISVRQMLLYKGTGAILNPPVLEMSYTLGVDVGGVAFLYFTDGYGNLQTFSGPTLPAGQTVELWVVKQTTAPIGLSTNLDPTSLPFGLADLQSTMDNGVTYNQQTDPKGNVTVTNLAIPGNTTLTNFLGGLSTGSSQQSYTIAFAWRIVNDDGSRGDWSPPNSSSQQNVSNGTGLAILSTLSSHLLIGTGFDGNSQEVPTGNITTGSTGNIRKIFLFNQAIKYTGLSLGGSSSGGSIVEIADATVPQLQQAGVTGYWNVVYDPNSVVTSPLDSTAVAVSVVPQKAFLLALRGHEGEGMGLLINGYPCTLVAVITPPDTMSLYSPGISLLLFNAGLCKLAEISMWQMARQQYQVLSDMYGRLVTSNEPYLKLYLSASFVVQSPTTPPPPPAPTPFLPMALYIDNIEVVDPIQGAKLPLSNASLDIFGCPAIGRCGPLITPNLYTPPGLALTLADLPPDLVSYSVTISTTTGTPAGVIMEAYAYVQDNAIFLYTGKKVGDLVFSWVSQEQSDVQVMGYIEGAPPCPASNLTNRPNYNGATQVSLTIPTTATLRYDSSHLHSSSNAISGSAAGSVGGDKGIKLKERLHTDPMGCGLSTEIIGLNLALSADDSYTWGNDNADDKDEMARLQEARRYTVKMGGSLAPYTNDLFMQNLNAAVSTSNTPGAPAAKTAILPNPNLGGFTVSNPAGALPRAATEEKYGSRMFVPSPYGHAFVTSSTVDIYQQTLLQTNTVYGFLPVVNTDIPRDVNIIPFRMSSKYLRPGCLDGNVTYGYNPATLPTGKQTYTTSTGLMQMIPDLNFPSGLAGHDASYMRVVDAYRTKKQIDQETFNVLALYNSV